MDDVPAGPASPEPRRPPLSVVIPVRNGGLDFERCLRRLLESSWSGFELIVVDDGSSDGSAALARDRGAIVARNDRPLGPAAARNQGAQLASAPLIFFLDADVAVHPDALARAMARFARDPGLTALFGSYDDKPSAPGLVSRFRNLLHHHVHQQGAFEDDARPAHTFWTGCGLIRRDVFLDFGGFDPRLYPRPAIEDIELGYRLTRAGHRIVLARDVLATHMKRWTIPEMVRTDIFCRGVPWTLLMKRSRTVESDLNVKPAQKVCVILTAMVILSLPAMAMTRWASVAAAVGAAGVVALNRDFYGFLARTRGGRFAAGALPVHLVYYSCCGCSVIIALFEWHILGRLGGTAAAGAGGARLDRGEAGVPRPFLVRLAGRLARWTRRTQRSR
ncbi:GalNAc(5)-diNAcBac-PP-undecaprenol beta-1,3-glucosyltransferase [Aquisphaera giovannonii]|uniref:GalNAc(5)-diNAcBac-PP-undecaprenol beta-1,3-glucosyltransferase n=1 Tax=Aquisphaera giovannonii TaxID=406548 RepID=A0A5B9W927_9BACT|nr:glycosyltransferase family A protein [Aquisphaera giovannonii]QEH36907.1 GalNAc(5)-diNAcBac-PP-undecaprenol beta-1,3-glucosyltransferase [Aquisphaera giovannonii]